MGATQQFTAQALDQFLKPLANQPRSLGPPRSGTINAFRTVHGPEHRGSLTVTAKSGAITGTATVTVLANSGACRTRPWRQLVQSLDADGSISRNDMIQILRSVAADGTVSATDFSDLKKILSQAATLNMPGYVQALAGDVINGNAANATYQGQTMGNLAVGSSGTQLTD